MTLQMHYAVSEAGCGASTTSSLRKQAGAREKHSRCLLKKKVETGDLSALALLGRRESMWL